MANLKRLWDTENKKIVWAIPTSEPYKKLQVWTNDDGSKLYVYRNSQYLELDTSNATVAEYGHYRKELDDEMVGYYLTSEPTNLYNRDSGDKVAYRFMNGTTVLQSGTVDEGETPEYTGETPTKESTAQYTYTFSGWQPTVGPITKKTDFKAQFTRADREYTISIAPNDSDYGAVSESSVDVPYRTPISVDEETGDLTIGTGESATVVTATAEEGYTFDSWTDDLGEDLPATVTGDLSVVAVFEQEDVPTPPDDFTITINAVNFPEDAEIMINGPEDYEETIGEANLPYFITIPGGQALYGSAADNSDLSFDSRDYSQGYHIQPMAPDSEWTRQSSPYTIDEDGNFSDMSSNNTFTITFVNPEEEEEPQEEEPQE